MSESTLRDDVVDECRAMRGTLGSDECYELADRILALVSARGPVMPPIKWIGDEVFVAGLFVGHVVDQRPHTERGEYRAWISTSMDSEPLGYGSKEEAMELVELEIRKRLSVDGTNARGGPVMPAIMPKCAGDAIDDILDIARESTRRQIYTEIRAALLDEQKG